MRVVFIIILVYKIITAENSESKYIDLLPDKDKEEFLENIARRILEEVQAKNDKPKTSGEVTEDQLNQHDAFVQKLMKEEALNLRKKTGGDANENPDPDTSVIGLDKKENLNNEDRHVDLTLRTGTEHGNKRDKNRRVFTGFTEDNENNSDQDGNNNEESDVDIQVKNIRKPRENADETPDDIDSVAYTKDNIAGTVTTTLSSLINNYNPSTGENADSNRETYPDSVNTGKYLIEVNEAKAPKEIETTMYSADNLAETTLTTLIDNNNKTSDKHSEENSPKVFKETDETTENADTNNSKSIKKIDVNYTTTKELTSITEATETHHNISSRVLRSYGENTNINTQQDNNSKINNIHINKTVKKPSVNYVSTSKVNSDEERDSKVINIITETAIFPKEVPNVTQNDTAMNTHKKSTDKNVNIDTETTKIELTTISPISEDTTSNGKESKVPQIDNKKPKLEIAHIYLKEPDKKNVEEMTVKTGNLLVNGMMKMLRQNLKDNAEYSNVPLLNTEIKEYKVHEISPDATPFVKKTQVKKPDPQKIKSKLTKTRTRDVNKEQPFYVPIYNYSPNNAFYNPDNVFGPTDDAGDNKDDNKVFKVEKDLFTTDNDDHTTIVNFSNEDSNKFDWDYYFEDKHLRKFRIGLKTDKNSGKNEPYRVNPPQFINNYSKTRVHVKPSDYLDVDYNPEEKGKLLRKDKKQSKTTLKPLSSLFDSDFKYSTDAVRNIRKLLFQTKNWGFIEPIKDRTTTPELEPELEPDELIHENVYVMRAKGSKKKTSDVNDENQAEKYLKRKNNHGPYYRSYKHKHGNFRIPLRINSNSDKMTVIKHPKLRQNEGRTDYNLMRHIIDMVPGGEIMPILKKLKQADIKKSQRIPEVSNDIDVHVVVMGDMIKDNSKALKQYDWLETTVNLQSAIKKIIDMSETVQKHEDLHPSDLELLKFLIYLFKLARGERQVQRTRSPGVSEKEHRAFLPKSRIKNRGVIKESGLLNRLWLIRMVGDDGTISDDDLKDFDEFLDDLQNALYDLHITLKYISMVTIFRNQKWFDDLKILHIDWSRKEILELILHISTANLLELIEESTKNGLDDNYLDYVDKNEKEVIRMKEDLVFVFKLLKELKNIR